MFNKFGISVCHYKNGRSKYVINKKRHDSSGGIDFKYDLNGFLISETWIKKSDDKICYRFIYKYLF